MRVRLLLLLRVLLVTLIGIRVDGLAVPCGLTHWVLGLLLLHGLSLHGLSCNGRGRLLIMHLDHFCAVVVGVVAAHGSI